MITDVIGRIFSIPFEHLGFGATNDDEPLPVLTFYAKTENPEHLLLGMVREIRLRSVDLPCLFSLRGGAGALPERALRCLWSAGLLPPADPVSQVPFSPVSL